LGTAQDYWRAWLTRQGIAFSTLSPQLKDAFTRSLLVVRAHADSHGGIIASSDTGIMNQGRDTYAYVWPRDAAYAVRALVLAGDFDSARRFFEFANTIVAAEGYFMHKYLPDGSVGSSWHPWYRNGVSELPIQADETAIILIVLKEYYQVTRDLEFIESVFNSLVKRSADFLAAHVDQETGLPKPSYDLWEEVYCVSTYTASATYGALRVGEYFADLLGKHQLADSYRRTSERMRTAIVDFLWSDAKNSFVKAVFRSRLGEFTYDYTLDISGPYGLFEFGVLALNDKKLSASFETMERELLLHGETIGGMPRNSGDMYYRSGKDAAPNPWTVTTLWYAQYLLARVKTKEDLAPVLAQLEWVVERATESGMFSEQVNPYTGEALSVTPLVWSHAELVTTVIEYLQKMDDLGLTHAAYPLRRR
jgi:GH15 family glucan-1,4-alpha-glucosidase